LELAARREAIKAQRAVTQDQLAAVVAEMMARDVRAIVPEARYLDLVDRPNLHHATWWVLGYVRDSQGRELFAPGDPDLESLRDFFNSEHATDYNDCFGGPEGYYFDLEEGRVVSVVPQVASF